MIHIYILIYYYCLRNEVMFCKSEVVMINKSKDIMVDIKVIKIKFLKKIWPVVEFKFTDVL